MAMKDVLPSNAARRNAPERDDAKFMISPDFAVNFF
jgi:hypothetical protein